MLIRLCNDDSDALPCAYWPFVDVLTNAIEVSDGDAGGTYAHRTGGSLWQDNEGRVWRRLEVYDNDVSRAIVEMKQLVIPRDVAVEAERV